MIIQETTKMSEREKMAARNSNFCFLLNALYPVGSIYVSKDPTDPAELFGGSWTAIAIVFVATLIGFSLKSFMQKRHISHYVIFVISALVSSLIASVSLLFDATPDIAIGTSVLFLIPGVPLLNGVIDIVESHILLGMTRLVGALLLVMCIAVGLSITLAIVHNGLLLL